MPVWVVTGGSGFLGSHLLARLAEAGPSPVGEEVVAVGRSVPGGWSGRFEGVDLDKPDAVARVAGELRPSVVFHLAGRTPPARPEEFYRSNTLATVALLDALRGLNQPVRVVLVGSAAELGPVPVADLPVGESWLCCPLDAYGLSKWLATAAGLAAQSPLEVVVARVFNPIGPGLPESQALGRFARALAEGQGPTRLTVGDLDARRDFVDVRDVAEALIALATRGESGRVFHVGTGRSRRVGDGLDRVIALSGRRVSVEVAPSFGRPSGPSDSRADIARITLEVGWSPRTEWERSLADLWASVRPSGR